MQYDVFISYARKDYEDQQTKEIIPGNIVSRIKQLLDDNKLTYWFDEAGIYSGDQFAGVIADAIEQSTVFLYISTAASNDSKWTINEIATAKHLDKKIIPFRYDESKYNKSILMYLAPLDHIEYPKNKDKAFGQLIASIKTYKHTLELAEQESRRAAELAKQREQEKLEKQKQELEKQVRVREINQQLETLSSEIQKKKQEQASINIVLEGLEKRRTNLNNELAFLTGMATSYHPIEEEENSCEESDGASEREHKKKIYDVPAVVTSFFKRFWSSLREIKLWPLFKHLKNLKKRYFLHFLLLSLGVWLCLWNVALFGDFRAFLYVSLPIITPYCIGIIQLLRGKKDGIIILIFNLILLSFFISIDFSADAGIVGLIIYAIAVFLLYLTHKCDRNSNLAWSKMQKSRFKHPLRAVVIVYICSLVILCGTPHAFVRCSGLNQYNCDRYDALGLWHDSFYGGVLRDSECARDMGDFYMKSEHRRIGEIELDAEKALWWYSVAKDSERINACRHYMEAQEKGYYESDIYGKCGINREDGTIVRISIDSFRSALTEEKEPYIRDQFYDDCVYFISLKGADLSQGEFKVEGASLDVDTYSQPMLHEISGDSVVIRFMQKEGGYTISEKSGEMKLEKNIMISERTIHVIKTTPSIVVTSERGYPVTRYLKREEEYTIHVENPRQDANLSIRFAGEEHSYEIPTEVRLVLKDHGILVNGKRLYESKKYVQKLELVYSDRIKTVSKTFIVP